MAEDLFSGLLGQLASHHPLLRLEAATQLGRLGNRKAVPSLVDRLADPDTEVRQAVIQALASLGGREVVARLVPLLSLEQVSLRNAAMDLLRKVGKDAPDLILALLEEDDRDLRIFAVDILGAIGSGGVGKALIRALTDPDPNVRAAAAVSLGRRRDSQAVPALVKALGDDMWVRFSAIEALAAIGDPAALEPLLEVMQEPDELLQASIADALGNFSDPRAVTCLTKALAEAKDHLVPLLVNALLKTATPETLAQMTPSLRERAVLGLVDALSDPGDQMQASALQGLAQLGDTGSVYAILDLARRSQDSHVAEQILKALIAIGATGPLTGAALDADPKVAVAALGQLGGEGVCPTLIRALGHASPRVRRRAAVCLGDLGCQAALAPLEAALDDPDPQVKKQAVVALGCLRQERAVPSLGVFLAHHQLDLRMEALRSLLAIGGEQVRGLLLAGLASDDALRREISALGLGSLGVGLDASRLTPLLEDSQGRVRRAAVQALAESGLPGVWNTLGKVFDDPEPMVRLALVQALGRHDHHTAHGLLVRALDDREPNIRYQAVEALGRMGAGQAVEPLVRMLQDYDKTLKIAAARSLGSIGSPEANDHLLNLLADGDPEVRATATKALQQIAGGWG